MIVEQKNNTVLVTGGAGYIGSKLVPKLLQSGHHVIALDTNYFGKPNYPSRNSNGLELITGDIRDLDLLSSILKNVDTVIHLAAVANDPSMDTDPNVGKSINLDCLPQFMVKAKMAGCRRFIYASSASVYGINDAPEVDENQPCRPITLYSTYKAKGEEILSDLASTTFETISVRAATVCGWSPRQRFDLTVNMLTMNAILSSKIPVFGGYQYRPNVHIEDLSQLYLTLVNHDSFGILNGKAINVGCGNYTVSEIAIHIQKIVAAKLDSNIQIHTTPSNDHRSYRLNSDLVRKELGFIFTHGIESAIHELCEKWKLDFFPKESNPLSSPLYNNLQNMLANNWSYRG